MCWWTVAAERPAHEPRETNRSASVVRRFIPATAFQRRRPVTADLVEMLMVPNLCAPFDSWG